MKLATVRSGTRHAAVRIDGAEATELGFADLGELLAHPNWRELAGTAQGSRRDVATLDYAPLVPRPQKIICVGLNYRGHILEMGRQLPDHPTLFAKYPPALVGAYDEVVLPADSEAVDWEAELAVVVGTRVRYASRADARAATAGYSVLNDVTARDWQYRTLQWLQGKTFEETTPLGPVLVTADAVDDEPLEAELSCTVDGEVMQRARICDLVFDPADLIGYLSSIMTLMPGDVIATGTPGGVGHSRDPRQYLADGQVLATRVEGVGECRNPCRKEKLAT